MSNALPSDVLTRKEAAAILGVSRKRVTNLRSTGELTPADVLGRKNGLFWRHEVEALAEARAERRRTAEARATPPPGPPVLPPDQEATFEELMAAAEWDRENPGDFVDTEGAAGILGVTPQYVGRLAAQGRLPWLPTGTRPTRVYRRTQIEVIARARSGRT